MRDTVAKWTPYQAYYIRNDWSEALTYYAWYIREESSEAVASHFDFNLAISGSHILITTPNDVEACTNDLVMFGCQKPENAYI